MIRIKLPNKVEITLKPTIWTVEVLGFKKNL